MTPEQFAKICEWDAKITWPENAMFGVTIDRRRLIEYVKELQAALRILHDGHHRQPCVCYIAELLLPYAHV